jgi:Tfp pilus assembly protein PilO
MSGYEGAMAMLMAAASITAIYGLILKHDLDKIERKKREEREAKPSAPTPG